MPLMTLGIILFPMNILKLEKYLNYFWEYKT